MFVALAQCRSLLLAAVLAAMGGCERVISPAIDISRCDAPDYLAALAGSIDEIEIWAGNRGGFAPSALLVSQDQGKITAQVHEPG